MRSVRRKFIFKAERGYASNIKYPDVYYRTWHSFFQNNNNNNNKKKIMRFSIYITCFLVVTQSSLILKQMKIIYI